MMNSLYAAVIPTKDVAFKLMNHFIEQGVPDVLPDDKFHTTIVYSTKAPVNYEETGKVHVPKIFAMPTSLECWQTQSGKNALVLRLFSPHLSKMHEQMMERHQLSYDFEEYKPHMTISYDIKLFDWKNVQPFNYPIEFDVFCDDEVDEDWRK